jgi:hypothetical protein
LTLELWKAWEKKMKGKEKRTQPEDEKLPNNFSLTQNNFVYNLSEATK